VRAFLNIEPLFPLRSPVELLSGKQAQVIRRPRNGFAAPVVVDENEKRIEMESAEIQILRPVCSLELNQVRLTPEGMEVSQWHPAGPDTVV